MTNQTQTYRHPNLAPTTWWGQQWQDRLEHQAEASRVQRAHKYLRAEIVTILELGPDEITGQTTIQESNPRRCSISVSRLSQDAVHLLAEQLENRPGFAYQLAHRELPLELDQLLAGYGEQLVPTPDEAIISKCDCPDAAPPCTHCAAVYIMAGQRFEQNPILLLKSRGVDIDAVNDIIRQSTEEIQRWSEPEPETAPKPNQPQEGAATAQHFWADDDSALRAISIPPTTEPNLMAEPIHRLGPFPNWQSELPFVQTMESIYQANATHISSVVNATTKPAEVQTQIPEMVDDEQTIDEAGNAIHEAPC